MNNEQIAAKWASGVFSYLRPEHQICNGEGLRDTFLCAINEALEHQEKRIAELEAENERLREEKIFVGYTNGYQLFYAAATEDENGMPCGEGRFYADTDNDTTIPLYILATHKDRIESTSNGNVTYEMIKALRGEEIE